MTPEQITRNASAISGAIKMIEREIANFLEGLSETAATDDARRQISDYLNEMHFHFRTLATRAESLESETRSLLGTQTTA